MPESQSHSVDELPLHQDRVLQGAPHFPRPEVFRFMGGGNGRLGTCQTIKKVHNWTKRLRSIVTPRIVYSFEPLADVTTSCVRFDNGTEFKSVKMAKALKRSHHAVCFVATLGHAVEEVTQELTNRHNLSEAFVVDAIGSVGVEQLVEGFYKSMAAAFRKQGKGVTLRFSPGYCDWAVGEQRKLFRLVDSHLIGVDLSDSSLMTPKKSVSGVFGVTDSFSARLEPYNPCHGCGKTDCIARRDS
jgi:hypothetical protein